MKKSKLLVGILAVGIAVFTAVSGTAMARSLTDLNRQRQELRDEQAELRGLLAEAQSEQETVLAEMILLDLEMMEAATEHLIILENLEYLEILLEETQRELDLAEIAREERFEILRSRLRFMHENGNLSYIELLLSSQDFSEFLNNREHFRRIVEHDNAIVSDLVALEQQITQARDDIADQTAALANYAAELVVVMANLEAVTATHAQRLIEIAETEAGYAFLLREAEAAERQIRNTIAAAEAEANRALAQQRSLQLNTGNVRPVDAVMQWPVAVAPFVTSEYGNRRNPITGRGEFHEGIDMRAPHNTAILAADDGVVIESRWMGGYGNTIIINHGDGLHTLYAHNTTNLVRVGDFVERGQTIARAGSTGQSTGPHLHFEVRINGNHTDPGPFLGLR